MEPNGCQRSPGLSPPSSPPHSPSLETPQGVASDYRSATRLDSPGTSTTSSSSSQTSSSGTLDSNVGDDHPPKPSDYEHDMALLRIGRENVHRANEGKPRKLLVVPGTIL
ncbi:hypothetical protein K431DRAFT_303877 [Polychaeton citri CBS 116435]|uniref:Uncharacterized protein n=1 Tax=Polychaeton citri CBS 116435 TaxID=1314669 RepID=A0A9P4Q7K6_9PEZI|nr:hypothetical protein K431DRAFT_303877 [Polychaeton citri CBS 116435]